MRADLEDFILSKLMYDIKTGLGGLSRQDAFIAATFALLSLGLACMAACQHSKYLRDRDAAINGQVIQTNPMLLLVGRQDLRGSAGTYTLVEFADYQCPPCRYANEKLPDALNAY